MAILFRKPKPINFQSILIVTYGRSGSTLLQGILNSIPGVVIRGENFDFCYHLFQSYQAIKETKKRTARTPQHPFFGAQVIDETHVLHVTSQLVKDFLLGPAPKRRWNFIRNRKEHVVNSYGFKEIRYVDHLEDLPMYLKYLEKIFPKPCFIINTRNHGDVLNSMRNIDFYPDREFGPENLEAADAAFLDFHQKNQGNSFHICYEDMVKKSDRLRAMFEFLGAAYDEARLDKTLALKHSYMVSQEHIDALPDEPRPKSFL